MEALTLLEKTFQKHLSRGFVKHSSIENVVNLCENMSFVYNIFKKTPEIYLTKSYEKL